MKVCARCKKRRRDTKFVKLKTGKLHSWCHDCRRAYRNDPARVARGREYSRNYRSQNEAKVRAYKLARRQSIEGRARTLYDAAKARARRNKLEFSLTVSWVEQQLKTACPLTGWDFDFSSSTSSRVNPRAPSLDRLDYRRGYTIDNTRAICIHANIARNAFTDAQLLCLSEAIVRTISREAPKGEPSTTIPRGSRAKQPEAHGTVH